MSPPTTTGDRVPAVSPPQSLVIPEKFQHILRVLNTNIDGRRKIAFAITAIKVRARGGHGGDTGVAGPW